MRRLGQLPAESVFDAGWTDADRRMRVAVLVATLGRSG